MISSTLFPSKVTETTKLPLIVTPHTKDTAPAKLGEPENKLLTAQKVTLSPAPPKTSKRGVTSSGKDEPSSATATAGKAGSNQGGSAGGASKQAAAQKDCQRTILANWSEGDPPIYTYEVITRNGKPMIEAAFKTRPWWGSCKTSWEEDAQCTFLFYPYNRTDDRSIIRARGAEEPFRPRLWNHVEWNKWLTSKKGLYFSLREYCESSDPRESAAEPAAALPPPGKTRQRERKKYLLDDLVPATYYIQSSGSGDEEMQRFREHVARLAVPDSSEEPTESVTSGAQGEADHEEGPKENAAAPAEAQHRNFWIVKPAAGSNQGDGIRVLGGDDVAEQVAQIIVSGGEEGVQGGRGGDRGWKQFGWIVQKYIERPLLVHGRKFDLRCYVLLVLERPKPVKDNLKPEKQRAPERLPHHSDRLTAFLYDEGYVRTSSAPYSLDQSGLSNIAAHLTNDAVQKQFEGEYGKHESANKLDFKQFQAYISKHHNVRQDFVQKSLLPTLRDYVRVSVTAASQAAFKASQGGMQCSRISSTGEPEYEADGRGRGGGGVVPVTKDMHPNADEPLPAHGYELLGYDFMLDDQMRLQLIEVNSNPCMDRPCKVLQEMLPKLNDDVFRTAIDPHFPAPKALQGSFARAQREKPRNGFTKVFP